VTNQQANPASGSSPESGLAGLIAKQFPRIRQALRRRSQASGGGEELTN